LNIYVEHGGGAVGYHLPFVGFPDYHIHYMLTVSYGELDLLGTFLECGPWETDDPADSLWQTPNALPPQDPEGFDVEYWCDVPLASLPGKWSDVQHAPYFIRYKRFREKNFIVKRRLEFAGTYELVDPLIRLIKYKARPNENSNRIKSGLYNPQSYNQQPNELLVLEVGNLIDGSGSRPLTDRCVLCFLHLCFSRVCVCMYVCVCVCPAASNTCPHAKRCQSMP
jgi:hypothetical protein